MKSAILLERTVCSPGILSSSSNLFVQITYKELRTASYFEENMKYYTELHFVQICATTECSIQNETLNTFEIFGVTPNESNAFFFSVCLTTRSASPVCQSYKHVCLRTCYLSETPAHCVLKRCYQSVY